MPPCIRPETRQFLVELAENNDRDWFQANKSRYEAELKQPARELAAALNARLAEVAPRHVRELPHKALNRIHRDLRFSPDKAPYHTRVWMGFPLEGAPKQAAPAFYFGFDAEGWAVGAGIWKPPGPVLRKLRTHIAENHEALAALMAEPRFAADFGGLQGEQLKRVPKPWTAEHPAAALLRHKDLHIRYDAPEELLHAPDLVERVAGHFATLAPLVAFIVQALERDSA